MNNNPPSYLPPQMPNVMVQGTPPDGDTATASICKSATASILPAASDNNAATANASDDNL